MLLFGKKKSGDSTAILSFML